MATTVNHSNYPTRPLASVLLLALLFGLAACRDDSPDFDASGTFEAEETIISAEASGTILQLDLDEGMELKKGQLVGYIDSTQLYLKRLQLEAQLGSVRSRRPNVAAQTGFYDRQTDATQTRLDNLLKEQRRFEKLVAADAATPKQLDDINAQVQEIQKQMLVIERQKAAQVSALQTQVASVGSDLGPLRVQIEQLDDQLAKTRIVNPVDGTVLVQYAEANEMAAPGKPLYKIADLSTMVLRAYLTGNQLPQVKLNQKVTVLTDDGAGGYEETEGVVTWINSKAEFTPKTIQTKEERANTVYATKIKVQNDGRFKIGMYGEVRF